MYINVVARKTPSELVYYYLSESMSCESVWSYTERVQVRMKISELPSHIFRKYNSKVGGKVSFFLPFLFFWSSNCCWTQVVTMTNILYVRMNLTHFFLLIIPFSPLM